MEPTGAFDGAIYSSEDLADFQTGDFCSNSTEVEEIIAQEHVSKKQPGRKASQVTNILRLFSKISKSKKGKAKQNPPKLEYLRAFFNRFERKLIRTVVSNKPFKKLEIKLSYNVEGLRQCRDIINRNRKYLKHHRLGDKSQDPVSKSNKHLSFNEKLTSEFYSHDSIRELHQALVEAVFSQSEGLDAETFESEIEKFLTMSATALKVPRHESLRQLQCLLLSSSFRGKKSDEELCNLLATIPSSCEVIPAPANISLPMKGRQKNTLPSDNYDSLEDIISSSEVRAYKQLG
mmetsp:Transcript_19232/g.35275  ORF Transcript_19232/g.35275 Transcript_19232/m.35275 type:complete len:290 (-) Transcript_19232:1890-2759(-)